MTAVIFRTGGGGVQKAVPHLVAVVGAGPAGLACARFLAENRCRVILLNRDVKYGGLAEYGIYPTKHKMKEGLRQVFRQTLSHPGIRYFGHVKVGSHAALHGEDLREHASAVVFAAGAQGTKSLNIPGEDSRGVYPAKDLVYHYNRLPPFSQQRFEIGRRACIIGMGNVMVDVAHHLLEERKLEEVFVVARRGPAERKYDKKEIAEIAGYIRREDLAAEMDRILEELVSVGQEPQEILRQMAAELEGAGGAGPGHLTFRFLSRPARILKNGEGRVCGLEVEETRLEKKGDRLEAVGTGRRSAIACDSVIYAVGDRVDDRLGLPKSDGGFCVNPDPTAGEDGPYQAFDPKAGKIMEGVFLAGWCRKASEGRVGLAKRDGERAAAACLRYLGGRPELPEEEAQKKLAEMEQKIRRACPDAVTWPDLQALERAEKKEAERLGLPEFKFATNEEMLQAIWRPLPMPC